MKSQKNKWADHYTEQAKKENYPARSVYKLKEIQNKFKIIKKDHRVLDLGCSPGSWLLYTAEIVGKKGNVTGIDLKETNISASENIQIITGDVFDFKEIIPNLEQKFDLVLSDMAPSTTGRKDLDAYRSFELSMAALSVAEELLKKGGTFVCKIFQGEDFKEFLERIKTMFNEQKIYKPKSSRKASKEIYIIALNKKE